MKTFDEIAQEIVDKARFSTSGDKRVAKMLVYQAIKYQDQATRMDCINLVKSVDPVHVYGSLVFGQDIKNMNRHEDLIVKKIIKSGEE